MWFPCHREDSPSLLVARQLSEGGLVCFQTETKALMGLRIGQGAPSSRLAAVTQSPPGPEYCLQTAGPRFQCRVRGLSPQGLCQRKITRGPASSLWRESPTWRLTPERNILTLISTRPRIQPPSPSFRTQDFSFVYL